MINDNCIAHSAAATAKVKFNKEKSQDCVDKVKTARVKSAFEYASGNMEHQVFWKVEIIDYKIIYSHASALDRIDLLIFVKLKVPL